MLVYEQSVCEFESCYSHLNFRYRTCFEQGFPWHSGNYRVQIHFKTRTWHDKITQTNGYAIEIIWVRNCFCLFDSHKMVEVISLKIGQQFSQRLAIWWWWWWLVFVVWLTDERRLWLISSRDHCQRFSPSQISDTPRAGFESAQNLSSDFDERSGAVVIITTPQTNLHF